MVRSLQSHEIIAMLSSLGKSNFFPEIRIILIVSTETRWAMGDHPAPAGEMLSRTASR
jgi:hypothetical protein